tara:strand:+ start:2017 stop:2316 length:300 start_codon:yes stop_codon:yes gene_type:complete
MIKLTEIRASRRYTGSGAESYELHEVFINPQHVVAIREDHMAKQHLTEGRMPAGLDDRQSFTKIHLSRGQNGIDITVIGTPTAIENKINVHGAKQLLRG